jgi:hypothetical protein
MTAKTFNEVAQIETEARKLARSGNHRSFRSIQAALLARGLPKVPKVFANRWTCTELDRLCEQTLRRLALASGANCSDALI